MYNTLEAMRQVANKGGTVVSFPKKAEAKPETKTSKKEWGSRKFDFLDAMNRDPDLSPIGYKVGQALLQHVNQVSNEAWPKLDTLCQCTGLSVKQVRSAYQSLLETGWFTATLTKGGRNGQTHVFRPVWSKVKPFPNGQGSNDETLPDRDNNPAQTGREPFPNGTETLPVLVPEPLIEPVNQPPQRTRVVAPGRETTSLFDEDGNRSPIDEAWWPGQELRDIARHEVARAKHEPAWLVDQTIRFILIQSYTGTRTEEEWSQVYLDHLADAAAGDQPTSARRPWSSDGNWLPAYETVRPYLGRPGWPVSELVEQWGIVRDVIEKFRTYNIGRTHRDPDDLWSKSWADKDCKPNMHGKGLL